MSYPIPVFNLNANVWNPGHTPAVNVPDFTTFVQLYVSPHNPFELNVLAAGNSINIDWLVLVKTAAAPVGFGRNTIFQCRPSFTRYHKVLWHETYYAGFPQQFEGYLCSQCNANGTIPATY